MRRSMLTTAAAALTLIVMSACSVDMPTTSVAVSDSPSFHKNGNHPNHPNTNPQAGPAEVHPVKRPKSLSRDISISRAIGVKGGVLALPGAAATITVPPGALTQTTTITVTARKGENYAYEFEPHGLRFAVPLEIHQSLFGASGYKNPLTLRLGYYPDPAAVTKVSEILPVFFDPGSKEVGAQIWHFSGYIFAGGYEEY